MRAFLQFLTKEFTEIRRTWRLPTVGGVLILFAIMSPLAALATPAIVASVTSAQPGVVIRIPDPTYLDSYAQWLKNLSQMGLMLVIFSSAGLIAGERSSGTVLLVVTKPVSRGSFVAAKFVAQAVLVVGATFLGTALTHVGTLLAFGEAPAGLLWGASAVWLAGALLAVAITVTFSVVLPTLAAGIAGLVVVGLSGLVALWEPAARFTPVGLTGAAGVLLSGKPIELVVPLATGVLAIAAMVTFAAWLFGTREL